MIASGGGFGRGTVMLNFIKRLFSEPEIERPTAAAGGIVRENLAIEGAISTGSPTLDEAIELWFAWRGETDQPPKWTCFNPGHHPGLLPHIMLYKKIDERYACSLVGEAAGSYLPMTLAGKFLDEAMPAANLADVTLRLDSALSSGLPNFVEKTMAWQGKYKRTGYRALQLPFSAAEGGSPRVMSVMDFQVERINESA